MYDTIIIGGGPAGITASLYIKRAGFNVILISEAGGALSKANKIENYYGFDKPISGKTLLENGEKQAKALGVNIIKKEVIGIKYADNNYYEVITANQPQNEKYIGKTIVIATGANRNRPNIKGVKE